MTVLGIRGPFWGTRLKKGFILARDEAMVPKEMEEKKKSQLPLLGRGKAE